MNATNDIGRREFLNRTSTALGLLALGETIGGLPARGAETGAKKSPPDRAALEASIKEMEADGPIYLRIPPPDGRFLSLLVEATRAKNVLEIGTSHGYTAIWISRGLEETDGKLTTVEILPDRVEMARKHLGQAGLSHRVTFKTGDAHQLLPSLEGPFDFVFLNADKGGQVDYFHKLVPQKLLPGGLLIAYSAIQQREKMKDYLDLVGQQLEFDTVVLSCTMDDGFAVSCRKRK